MSKGFFKNTSTVKPVIIVQYALGEKFNAGIDTVSD